MSNQHTPEPKRQSFKTATFKTIYRKHDWLDTKTNLPKFGIQGKAVGWEVRWLHCAEDGKPLIYDTEAERDAKLKELRKRKVALLPSPTEARK